MELTLGILIVIIVCLTAVGIGAVAARNVKNYDESKHESFLG